MKKILLFALYIGLGLSTIAQSVTIDGIKGIRFKGVDPIVSSEDETISGYFTYYMVDKGDSGMRTFEFAIIDKEVTTVKTAELELHKRATINNTVFNGKYFLISYDDMKNKQNVFNVLDLDGKVVKTISTSNEKKRLTASTVYPAANGEGFYIVRPIAEKRKNGFSIEKVNNELDVMWQIEDVLEKGISRVSDLINTEDRFVIWKEHGVGLKKLKPQIICYDAKTGQQIFVRDGYDGTGTILYNQLRIDNDGGILAGGAYIDGEKYRSANSAGVYMLKLSPDGQEMLYTKVSNKENIQKVLKETSRGFTVGSKDKIWVKDLIVDEHGNIVIISEMFRKNINPKPMAYQTPRDLISGKFVGDISYRDSNGKAQKVTFEIMDYIIFKFNQNGELAEIKPILKEKYNKLTVYYPYVGLWGMDMAKIVDEFGWFDYNFSTTGENGERIMVCSNNAEARKPQVFTYTLDDYYAKQSIDLKQESKIDLDEGKVGYFRTMRNSEGKIAVAYFQRKLKRVTVNIEELY